MNEATESAPWKHKYYELLDRLEAEERQWAEAEKALRQAVGRLSWAASGIDRRLDALLEEVRAATRRNLDCQRLQDLNQEVGNLLPHLDAEPRPRGPRSEGKGGLLSSLFGKHRGRPTATDPADDGADGASRLEGQRALLLGVIDHWASRWGNRAGGSLEGLRERVREAEHEAALRSLTLELAGVLGEDQSPSTPAVAAGPSPAEVLLSLLERLSLPPEQRDDLEALKGRLRAGIEPDAWQGVVQAIAELVSQARHHAQREKQQFEAFLAQVTGRLEDMERFLDAQATDRNLSNRHGKELTQAVDNEVRSIETSVRNAHALSELQESVQERLSTIDRAMRDFTAKEAERIRDADQRTAHMHDRMRELEDETRQLRTAVHERYEQALKDPLTGIANRLAYEERATEELARSRRFGLPLALLVWDVDHFKQINDNYGHSAGDKALHKIAGILSDRMRETDFVARYGGEEFVMLLTGTDSEGAMTLAEEIRAVVEETPFNYSLDPVDISVSCGIAVAEHTDSPDTLFDRADKALYKAKAQGRNRCHAA